MTEKIYYNDSYLKTCEATVLEEIEQDGKILVVLDRTIFYPEGGGQPCDLGDINGIPVLEVQEKHGIIYHHVAQKIRAEKTSGTKVRLTIDWHRRFDHMQQHSGEHILSGVIYKEYKGNNKGFHLGEEIVTIDIDIRNMTEEQLAHMEALANAAIYEARPVRQDMTDAAHLASFAPRKEIAAEEDIRVVTIADTDVCACCGTHVRNAAEVGIIKILKSESHKGMSRITFVCGERAYQDYRKKHQIITAMKQELQTEEDKLIERTQKINQELQDLRYQVKEYKNRSADEEAKKLQGDKIYRLFDHLEGEQLEYIIKQNQNKEEDQKQILILGSAIDNRLIAYGKNLDIGKIFKESLKDHKGKGGGRGETAQAKFENAEDVRKYIEYLKEMNNEKNAKYQRSLYIK